MSIITNRHCDHYGACSKQKCNICGKPLGFPFIQWDGLRASSSAPSVRSGANAA